MIIECVLCAMCILLNNDCFNIIALANNDKLISYIFYENEKWITIFIFISYHNLKTTLLGNIS